MLMLLFRTKPFPGNHQFVLRTSVLVASHTHQSLFPPALSPSRLILGESYMCEKNRTGVYGGGSGLGASSNMLSVKQLYFIWTSCSFFFFFFKNNKKFQHLVIYSTASFLICISLLWKFPWQHKDSL